MKSSFPFQELLDLVGMPFAPLPLLAILDSTGTRTLLRAGEADGREESSMNRSQSI